MLIKPSLKLLHETLVRDSDLKLSVRAQEGAEGGSGLRRAAIFFVGLLSLGATVLGGIDWVWRWDAKAVAFEHASLRYELLRRK